MGFSNDETAMVKKTQGSAFNAAALRGSTYLLVDFSPKQVTCSNLFRLAEFQLTNVSCGLWRPSEESVSSRLDNLHTSPQVYHVWQIVMKTLT
jgi:hypothetical protein